MKKPVRRGNVIVLTKDLSGESGYLFALLTEGTGIIKAYKRASAKKISRLPDLFELIEAEWEESDSHMAFIKEYRVLATHKGIAENYACFEHACRFARVLSDNIPYGEHASELFELALRAFRAWDEGKSAGVVMLKGLYLVMKTEGYPVSQDWLSGLNSRFGKVADHILHTEIAQVSAEIEDIDYLNESLCRWIASNAHFHF